MQACWVSVGHNACASTRLQVKVINADNAVQVAVSDFSTVQGITVEVTGNRWSAATEPNQGHHALWGVSCNNVLFTK